VYAAHDPDLDRRVALKLLRSIGDDEELRARLSHPNVVTVHDVGAHGTQLFVAMEFVGGGTLRQWLGARPRGWREVLAVLVRAGRGLACAHAAGLVHRDFKPDNVLVGDDGRVRVTDFGLARAARDVARGDAQAPAPSHAFDTTITRTGTLIGTPAYMAPEQLRGEPADARADTFSFCVALHEALYGERPFEGGNVVRLRDSTSTGMVRPAPPGSPVPESVRRVLLGGLRPLPEDRPARIDDLLDALEAAAAEPARAVGVHADTLSPTDLPRAGADMATRRPAWGWAVVVAPCAAALIVAGVLGGLRSTAPSASPPAAAGRRRRPRCNRCRGPR
jgi:serine/threonine protein kinase